MAEKKKKTLTKKKRPVVKVFRRSKVTRRNSKVPITHTEVPKLAEKRKTKCSTCYAKRIYSPFNKFFINKPSLTRKSTMTHATQSGLSPKELSYLKATCQRKKSRYTSLRALAEGAVANRIVFSVIGSGNGADTVRQELKQRGWVEKMPENKMNLIKLRQSSTADDFEINKQLDRLMLSDMVSKAEPNFVWNVQDNEFINHSNNNALKNYLNTSDVWTSKQGLCQILNNSSWYYIEDVAEVNHPRTYLSDDVEDMKDLIKDFRLTACTSLLKWLISMSNNKKPIYKQDGKISNNVLVFALSRCKEYLLKKQNKDIDRSIPTADATQWNTFLKRYYEIMEKKSLFKPNNIDQIYLYVKCAKLFLKEMIKHRPQISCEGSQNVWIIKPGHCARGHGIRMSSKLAVITNLISNTSSKYVIQKYIEVPLLIHDTKFDIRQYYLVTSTQPLIIWMYEDCYLKFSSQNYNLNSFHESIHLTNNAIQKKYTNSKDKHMELPKSNMWDLSDFKKYLESINKADQWDSMIFPGMKRAILGVMLNCQNNLLPSKNRFQLFGCDFILDKALKPWLIEINSNPDLNSTTNVTAKICPELLGDVIKVVIDQAVNSRAPTGKFINIYKMPLSTMHRHAVSHELVITGHTLPLSYFYRDDVLKIDPVINEIILKKRDIKDLMKKLSTIGSLSSESLRSASSNGSSKAYGKTLQDVDYTDSEIELSLSANIITDVLNNILDNIDDTTAMKER